jgi:hypothetical protein
VPHNQQPQARERREERASAALGTADIRTFLSPPHASSARVQAPGQGPAAGAGANGDAGLSLAQKKLLKKPRPRHGKLPKHLQLFAKMGSKGEGGAHVCADPTMALTTAHGADDGEQQLRAPAERSSNAEREGHCAAAGAGVQWSARQWSSGTGHCPQDHQLGPQATSAAVESENPQPVPESTKDAKDNRRGSAGRQLAPKGSLVKQAPSPRATKAAPTELANPFGCFGLHTSSSSTGLGQDGRLASTVDLGPGPTNCKASRKTDDLAFAPLSAFYSKTAQAVVHSEEESTESRSLVQHGDLDEKIPLALGSNVKGRASKALQLSKYC